MEKATQIKLIHELMERLDAGTNVDAGGMLQNPSWVYTSPELAEKEWQQFFRGHPQLLGASADLPEPGAFLTCNDFGLPVLATRDADGEFRAFANVCRHRGVVVEGEERGSRSKFACPFHGWTYSNRGELIGVPKPEHFGEFDRSCRGLIALPALESDGLLWVHPDPTGDLDLEAQLGELAPELGSWDFGRLVYVGSSRWDVRLNWKLAIDTFGETYHFNTLHRNSLAANLYGNVQAYHTFGRNHRMTLCRRDIDTLRGKPESTWSITTASIPVYYLFPNVQLIPGERSLIVVRLYPVPGDPGRAVSVNTFYFEPEVFKAFGDEVNAQLNGFANVIRDEDYVAAAASQVGAESGVQDCVLFGRNEPALHHYHNTYREALGLAPLELIPPGAPLVE